MPHITKATKEDCGFILKCIKDLAEFEKAPKEVIVTKEQLEKDGFDEPRRFEAFIAWEDDEPAAMALYYHRYSTWKGLSLYLEDLYVEPKFRKRGLANLLMRTLCVEALERGCGRFEWQVLDWNQGAIDFYKSMGATLDPEWLNCRMVPENITAWLQRVGDPPKRSN